MSYDDLKKRLSIPEKMALKGLSHINQRFEGVINRVKQSDPTIGDKIRRF